MKINKLCIFTILSFLLFSGLLFAQLSPAKLVSNTFPEVAIDAIEMDPFDTNRILAFYDNTIYLTDDLGNSWNYLFELRGIGEQITFLESDGRNPGTFYIGTSTGLYRLHQETQSKIFRSMHKKENHVTALSINPFNPSEIFIGTQQGVLKSLDGGSHWQKCSFISLRETVFDIGHHPNQPGLLFLQTNSGLYKIETQENSVRKVLSSKQIAFEEATENAEEVKTTFQKRKIVFSLNDDNLIYLAHKDGLYFSLDKGNTWRQATEGELQLPFQDVAFSSSDDALFFLNQNGLWQYSLINNPKLQKMTNQTAIPLKSFTMDEQFENHLLIHAGTNIYQVNLTAQSHTFSDEINPSVANIFPSLEFELPPIQGIQKAALEYAHLTNNRLRSWERRVRLRSLFPSVGFDMERSVANNIDVDRGSTSAPDIFLDAPDEKDWTFSVGIEWELADLIWNDTETSIEIRERAFVDQREEVLNEVTRLYYDWKRIQMEIKIAEMNTPEYLSTREYLEKKIRAEEIVAQLDGLTGGYLSERSS